jgi:hypothetical protein
MEEDFFVGFDNDMDDFQNIVGKIKQRRADLKEATGAKTVLGAKLKRVVKPLSTQKNLKGIRDARKSGAMPSDVPTDMGSAPIDEAILSEAMATQASAEAGASMGDARTTTGTTGTTGADTTGLSMTAKIGIGVGALVVIGGIIFFATRK